MKPGQKYRPSQKTNLGIFTIWLLHLSGLIGILVGADVWFIDKTPLNLVISTLLYFWLFPLDTSKKIGLFAFIALAGMAAEWVGVHTGYLFGSYAYGDNLGPKLDGVPYLIGVNWALLSMASATVSNYVNLPVWMRVILGALLMVGLDFFMEGLAPALDFWAFAGGHPPVWNYICWFALALVFQWGYQYLDIRGNQAFSLNLLAAQFIFFIGLYAFYLPAS